MMMPSSDNTPSRQPSQNPEAGPAPSPLSSMDQLLPALLEINIRQARAGGETDLAQALQSLQRQLQAREST